jgi:hypothetical protein
MREANPSLVCISSLCQTAGLTSERMYDKMPKMVSLSTLIANCYLLASKDIMPKELGGWTP